MDNDYKVRYRNQFGDIRVSESMSEENVEAHAQYLNDHNYKEVTVIR